MVLAEDRASPVELIGEHPDYVEREQSQKGME